MRRPLYAAACLLMALLVAGCGRNEPAGAGKPKRHHTATQRHAAPLPPTPCPPGLTDCRSASGRIIYVEAVDPDGDGDAHFVLASRQSVTAPGLSVIDVKRSLRPDPLPGVGDRISAAGPVQTGSYGQRQIHAVSLHFARR